ncbi:MAG: leucine-rich repeat domain-containing protein [Bacteroidaceae bacterium]|nr:leucine-rich repeat domain-containing protein [Bacteroidaceae bacterium]
MKKLLFILASVLLPMAASADDSGSCGPNATYTFVESTGTLTISGKGYMDTGNSLSESPWNAYKGNIKKVVVEQGITQISKYAFDSCTNLTSVSIPASVTVIGNYAFSECTSLKGVVLPEGVKCINFSAFSKCSSLESVVIPSTVAVIENYAFSICPQMKSVTSYIREPFEVEENVFYYYNTTEKKYMFPNATLYVVKGTKAKYQATAAWNNFPTIEEVDDPFNGTCGENLTYSFDAASGTLTISGTGEMDGFKQTSAIPWYTYANSIKTVTVEEGVTALGRNAFLGLENMTEVSLPSTLTTIGINAFCRCSSLSSIVLPDAVKAIRTAAFSSCISLQSIRIPEGVTTLTKEVFKDCANLSQVEIPSSVTTIEDYAFSSCASLVELEEMEGLTTLGKGVFSGCSALKSFIIPQTMKSMGADLFVECPNLKTIISHLKEPIEIANNVFKLNYETVELCVYMGQQVNYEAADNWKDFKTISELPIGICGDDLFCSFDETTNTLTIRGNGPMGDYSKYDTPTGWMGTYPWRFIYDKIKTVTIESGVTRIGKYAFCFLKNLENVVISETVTSIGQNAFEDCTALQTIDIPSSVTSIESAAFCASGLMGIILPEGVTSVGSIAFASCSNLLVISIPASLTEIGLLTFNACPQLQMIQVAEGNPVYDSRDNCNALIYTESNSLKLGCKNTVIPNSVKVISINAFTECTGLKEITIPEGVVSIDASAFDNCTSLERVVIPSTVTSIAGGILGRGAFHGCTKLWDISCYIKEPFAIADDVFDEMTYQMANLNVLPDTKALYETTDGWKKFTFIEETLIDGIGATPLDNSQFTIHNSQLYDLAGQRLSKARRGVNIVNGKKYIKK